MAILIGNALIMLYGSLKFDFDRDGYLIVPNLIKPDICRSTIEASEKLPSALDKTFTPCMHPHRSFPAFLDVFKHRSITGIMEILLGGKIHGIQTEYFFGKPGTPGFAAHQDNYYVQAKKEVFGSAWLALEDVGPENGGLIVYKGSHVEPLLSVSPLPKKDMPGQDPDARRQEVIFPNDKYEGVDVKVPVGSVVFIHGHVVHKSHDNCSNGCRNVLLMTYIRQGENFRKGYSAKREIVNIY